jgi:hypothetical protein
MKTPKIEKSKKELYGKIKTFRIASNKTRYSN